MYITIKSAINSGQHYICQMAGCVWSPDVYPDAWELEDTNV